MEKDRHYRAYEGFKPANNGNTSSLKRSTSERLKTQQSRQVRCLCFGGVPDKASQHSFLKGFIINLGICALLVAYTLLGSFIFLAIEGGADVGLQQRTLVTTIVGNQHTRRNTSALLKLNHEARAKTVENIWLITEHLNILYRENWTRLADQEIARFQDQLVKRITEDMMASQNAGTYTGSSTSETVTERRVEYEWNFAKAFLYSLTVLTTIEFYPSSVAHNPVYVSQETNHPFAFHDMRSHEYLAVCLSADKSYVFGK
ncbi:hypothetical protein EAG_10034 [Camponotus floridanus]|uniref:Uncharacterized protein n=1 Tax=Camponotus floridanus TaxID=104421 RepID=E2AV51_CAMFO|nr:hypothetical protein EAG_10034 [Camponotus floridanus]